MKQAVISRVVMTFVTALTLSTGSISYADSSSPSIPIPQSTVSAYQYVQKKIVVGSNTHEAFGIVPVHGNQFYLNEFDLAYLLSLYQITLNHIGVAGKSFPALVYQIDDPFIGTPTNVHPFQPTEPVPAYGHLAKVDINGVYVGSVDVVSDHPDFPGMDDPNAEYTAAAFGVGASLDNISAQDLVSVFKLLNVNSTLTDGAWTFPAQPAGEPQSSGPSMPTLYAGGGSSYVLYPISIETHQLLQPIPFVAPGFFNSFFGMAITPDARLALVTSTWNGDAPNFVYPVNLVTNQPESPIPIDNKESEDIAITPDGKKAYVTNMRTNSVTPIDLTRMKAGTAIAVGGQPWQVVISQDGKTAYVIVNSSIVPIDVATDKVGASVGNVPYYPGTMNACRCVVADGKLYILTRTTTSLMLIEFDPATGKTVASINVGKLDIGNIALAPDGKTIYLVGTLFSPGITAVDLKTKSTAWQLSLSKKQFPNGLGQLIQISPDGRTAYVEAGANLLSIDLVHHKLLSSTVPVGSNTFILAMAPNQPPTAAFTTSRGARNTILFDASGSKSDMPIAKYVWNFGDGTTIVSSVPTVKHVYAKSGTYTVTLTETDTAGATVNNPLQFNGHMVMVNAGSASAQTSRSVTV